jgi:hypothetical protein
MEERHLVIVVVVVVIVVDEVVVLVPIVAFCIWNDLYWSTED